MITILGSTGTIGKNTLAVLKNESIKIFALTARINKKLLYKQIIRHKPPYAVIESKNDADYLSDLCKKNSIKTKILYGKEGLVFVASHHKNTYVLSAIVGAAALEPTYAAVIKGKKVLLANKESLIMSGSLLVKAAKKFNALLIPVDSEHNAILQILTTFGSEYSSKHSNYTKSLKEIFITASGGPFLGYSKKQLEKVTPAQAIKHPTWKMGKKISIDSATMMNKGLEVIEASILFRLDPEKIKILIHPESLIHAMIHFMDGSIISHMSPHDMKVAISYALSWPNRSKSYGNGLEVKSLKSLSFRNVKKNEFKCLDLCIKALKLGFNAPTILNAANEVAVEKFLENRIKFIDIPVIIDKALRCMPISKNSSLKSILLCDQLTRNYVNNYIDKIWK